MCVCVFILPQILCTTVHLPKQGHYYNSSKDEKTLLPQQSLQLRERRMSLSPDDVQMLVRLRDELKSFCLMVQRLK